MLKTKKRKFTAIAFLAVLFVSSSVYAVSQLDFGAKFNEIVDAYLTRIVEEKMAEVDNRSKEKQAILAAGLQEDLDRAKLDAGAELERYIEEKLELHLINLDNMEVSLKDELLRQTELTLEEQKKKIDDIFAQEEKDFLDRLFGILK